MLHCLIKLPVDSVPLYDNFLLTLSHFSPVNDKEDAIPLNKPVHLRHQLVRESPITNFPILFIFSPLVLSLRKLSLENDILAQVNLPFLCVRSLTIWNSTIRLD